VEWEERVYRWVFGRGSRSAALPKRDVYAEFLNHPPGVCPIVDPMAAGCSGCGGERDSGDKHEGNYSQRVQSEKERFRHSGGYQGGQMEDDEENVGEAAGAAGAVSSRDGVPCQLQRADEGWHGDPRDIDIGGADCTPTPPLHRASRPPTPEAVLQAASRTLSECLEVAVQNAVDSVPSLSRLALASAGGAH
ncbi:unnamed protein product, partial [Laminaria digitata]